MGQKEDPRLSGDYVRTLGTVSGEVTLVGVVHDHPSSMYRVREIVQRVDPEILALELPPLAVPLYTEYAQSQSTPPSFGGEMSTAIQAAAADRVVGIDGPSLRFAGYLARRLHTENHSLETARAVFGSLGSVTKHAVLCRVAALVTKTTGMAVEVDDPVEHDADWRDDPERQASDERTHVRRAQTVMNAFASSGASAVRKRTREEYMADRLTTLAEEGDVVGVVGIGHLDELSERLGGR